VLVNVPEVDCSYKYASGGLLSTVEDILTFGHAMLFSYQSSSSTFLQSSTVHELWTTQVLPDSKYTLGWCVWPSEQVASEIKSKNQIWYHTGAGTGASSILLIKAHESAVTETNHPQGICVAVLVNMSGINACDLAREIVGIYEH
jgi:serine beta-lactamase-like protein LACTB